MFGYFLVASGILAKAYGLLLHPKLDYVCCWFACHSPGADSEEVHLDGSVMSTVDGDR